MKKTLTIAAFTFGVAVIVASYFYFRRPSSGRDLKVIEWINDPKNHPEWMIKAKERCPNAPFILPTSGFIGYLWDDSFQIGHRHQGIDIFGAEAVGETPVFAAYDGFLTRLPGWKSSLIVRIPNDPLQSNRQIWVYYTHLADASGKSLISPRFPQGSSEQPVKAGDLLGFQGNYSGKPDDPVGIHLHFSIVRDNGQGAFLSELDINNTLDPSPYLGLKLNANSNMGEIPVCQQQQGEG